jgi:hypothetical protein
MSACLLGQRFSIVAISSRIRAWYRETVEHNGLVGRLASIRGLDEPLADIGTVQADQGERLVALAERCVKEDGADVIVLAGAPLAGLARTLARGCRCRRWTACRRRCAMPRAWWRCGPSRPTRPAASRRRRSSPTRG